MNLISYFTSGGIPITGLSPTIQGWKIDGTQVIGQNQPSAMIEITNGYYSYDFSYSYNDSIDYIFEASGGISLPQAERYSFAINTSFRSSSIISHGDNNWMGSTSAGSDFISSQLLGISSQIRGISSQLYNISANLPLGQWHGEGSWEGGGISDLSEITPEIDYISSQITWISSQLVVISSQIYPSGDIIRHGDNNWTAASTDVSPQVDYISTQIHNILVPDIEYISSQIIPLNNDINWISSQVNTLSSQISGVSLGGGATPTQIWSYSDRTLTDDNTSRIEYISSQVTWISSQIDSYGGGGGGKSYISYTSKQGPWKYKEKEEIRQEVKDILNLVKEYQSDMKNYKEEEKDFRDKINNNLIKQKKDLVNILNDIKSKIETSNMSDKNLTLILSECDMKLKKLESMDVTSSNIDMLRQDVEKLIPSVLALLQDEKLEELGMKYAKV